jgi:hypothetical protein
MDAREQHALRERLGASADVIAGSALLASLPRADRRRAPASAEGRHRG